MSDYIFYIPKHHGWVNIKIDPAVRDEIMEGFKFYFNRNICLSVGREFEHIGVDGDYVLYLKPNSYRFIIRENNVHAEPRVESNLIEFALEEWDVLEITIDMLNGKPRLTLGENRKMQDNGVTPEQACLAYIEAKLAQIEEPLPEGVSFWVDSKSTLLVQTLDDFYDQEDTWDAWDFLPGPGFALPMAADGKELYSYGFLRVIVEKYIETDAPGAQKLKKMRAVTVTTNGIMDIVRWVDPVGPRPAIPVQPKIIPEMNFDGDDYFVWRPRELNCCLGVECDKGDEPYGIIALDCAQLPEEGVPFPFRVSCSRKDLDRLDTLTYQHTLIFSSRLKAIFEQKFGRYVVWYPLRIISADGVSTNFWAIGMGREAMMKDASQIEGVGCMGPNIVYTREIAKELYQYIGYSCTFTPLSEVQQEDI